MIKLHVIIPNNVSYDLTFVADYIYTAYLWLVTTLYLVSDSECLLSLGAEYFVFKFVIQNIKIKINRTAFMPVVCYGRETWSVTLREEHRLRVSAKWVLRKVFGSKSDEIREKWRKLHKEELNDLYSYLSPDDFRVIKSGRMISTGLLARMGQRESAYRALVERLEGKRSLGRPRLRWKDNTKLIFKKWDGKASIGLVWLRIVTDEGLF